MRVINQIDFFGQTFRGQTQHCPQRHDDLVPADLGGPQVAVLDNDRTSPTLQPRCSTLKSISNKKE